MWLTFSKQQGFLNDLWDLSLKMDYFNTTHLTLFFISRPRVTSYFEQDRNTSYFEIVSTSGFSSSLFYAVQSF